MNLLVIDMLQIPLLLISLRGACGLRHYVLLCVLLYGGYFTNIKIELILSVKGKAYGTINKSHCFYNATIFKICLNAFYSRKQTIFYQPL